MKTTNKSCFLSIYYVPNSKQVFAYMSQLILSINPRCCHYYLHSKKDEKTEANRPVQGHVTTMWSGQDSVHICMTPERYLCSHTQIQLHLSVQRWPHPTPAPHLTKAHLSVTRKGTGSRQRWFSSSFSLYGGGFYETLP